MSEEAQLPAWSREPPDTTALCYTSLAVVSCPDSGFIPCSMHFIAVLTDRLVGSDAFLFVTSSIYEVVDVLLYSISNVLHGNRFDITVWF